MAGKKLLVADDSLTIQKVIRLALSNEGYEIQAVSDGNDAIQQISLFRPDVVLIDVSLPGRSAFEVKRSINEHSDLEEVRFVLMSSAFERVDEEQVSEVRFHGRLTKPFDPAHLRQVLSEVLAQVTAKRLEPTSILKRPSAEDLQELPTVPSPAPIAPIDHLWDPEQEKTGPMAVEPPALTRRPPPRPSMPPPAPPPLQQEPAPSELSESSEADIRHLTESTIRISGLDDFQWSVQEPSLKPPAAMEDHGNSMFEIEAPSELGAQITPPFRPERAEPSEAPEAFGEPEKITLDPPAFSPPPASAARSERVPPPPPTAAAATAVPVEQVEALVRDQVEKALERMVQNMIPEVAERLIKQEIHRMLSEQG